MIEFILKEGDYIELVQLLKSVKITMSGGDAKTLIRAEQVKRNGIVETRKRAKIRVGEIIDVMGKSIIIKSLSN